MNRTFLTPLLAAVWLGLSACGPETIDQAQTWVQVEGLVGEGALSTSPELSLSDRGWGPEAGRLLQGAPGVEGLRVLDLRGNMIGPGGALALADNAALSHLEVLRLGPGRVYPDGNRLTDAGAKALGGSAHLGGLRELYVSRNGLGAEGVSVLVGGPLAEGLEVLDLDNNAIGDAGGLALAHAGHLGPLRELHLGWTKLGPEGAVALAGAPALASIEVLLLASCPIGDPGAIALSEKLPATTRKLYLSKTGLGDPTAKALAGAAQLAGLTHLNLDSNGLTDAGAQALAESPHLKGVQFLSVRDNALTDAGKAALTQRFGERVDL